MANPTKQRRDEKIFREVVPKILELYDNNESAIERTCSHFGWESTSFFDVQEVLKMLDCDHDRGPQGTDEYYVEKGETHYTCTKCGGYLITKTPHNFQGQPCSKCGAIGWFWKPRDEKGSEIEDLTCMGCGRTLLWRETR